MSALSDLELPDDDPNEIVPGEDQLAHPAAKSFLEKVPEILNEGGLSTARKIFNKTRGNSEESDDARRAALERIQDLKALNIPKATRAPAISYPPMFSPNKPVESESIEVPDDLVLPDTFDIKGQYGSQSWIDQRAESSSIPVPDDLVLPDTFDIAGQYGTQKNAKSESIPVPDDLVLPDTFDITGQYGSHPKHETESLPAPDDLILPDTFDVTGQYAKKYPLQSPPAPADEPLTAPEELVLPDTFDITGQYGAKNQPDAETIPVEEGPEQDAPINFISEGISKGANKGRRGSGGGAGGGGSTGGMKAPPIASQIPPPPPSEEEGIAESIFAGGPSEGAEAFLGLGAGVAGIAAVGLAAARQSPTSISEFQPGHGRHEDATHQINTVAIIAALTRAAGIKSRF